MKYAGTNTRAIVDDCQYHLHIENYMTEAMWTMLASPLSFDTKLASMAEFIVDIVGVHFPKEVTYTSILGVIIAANGERMSFRAAHRHLQAFKELVVDRRKKKLSHPGLARYTHSVGDFIAVCPGRYAACSPPVVCPIEEAMIKSGRYLVSAHGANERLKAADHPRCKRTVQCGVGSRLSKRPTHGNRSQSTPAAKAIIDIGRTPTGDVDDDPACADAEIARRRRLTRSLKGS